MADPFLLRRGDLGRPAVSAFTITPHATDELSQIPQALYVGSGGDIACRLMGDGADVTFVGVQTGAVLPVRVSHVRVSGTTANSLLGLY